MLLPSSSEDSAASEPQECSYYRGLPEQLPDQGSVEQIVPGRSSRLQPHPGNQRSRDSEPQWLAASHSSRQRSLEDQYQTLRRQYYTTLFFPEWTERRHQPTRYYRNIFPPGRDWQRL